MSGPFRFHEEARSPLDRSASPFSAGQPVSFKTNINRAKTKKWVQAKKNAYDGDDWGDYDEYDEYGVNQELQEPQEPQPERPAAQRYYAQRTEQPSRSFTDPSQQALHPRARKNSFDQGEEQRAFSSAMSHGQPHGDSRDPPYGYDTGGAGDFSPSAVPPPLQPRISQVPANFTPPTNTQFPPRKSSIGQGDLPIVSPPRPRNGSGSDKPLPIVRPADIYKRHQEEQERAPANIDSVLSPAQEGKSPSPSDDQDLRSVVNQAFTRVDDSRSVPPTPTSNDTSSDLLRSNTGSTSGISPIMSRVPSSAASALKTRNQAEGSTPVITEEPAEATTPVAQPTSENGEPLHHVPRKPSPAHSRNISGSSIPRSGLATPTRGDSPARSPVLAPSRDIPEPKSALFSTDDDISPEAMKGGLQGPSLEYAAREADLAASASSRPNSGVLDLGAAQRQSQNMFLESHNTQSPIEEVVAHDRSESPSKGRVQALAGKFGEVSSRRGSTQSNRSRNSLQSWEQSQNNSRAASPTKGSPPKPSSPVKEFRPHLPGQWESYTTTAMTPSEQGEQDRGLDPVDDKKTLLEKSDLTPTTAKQPVAEVSPTEADNSDPMVALKNAGAAMVDSIRTTIGINEQSSEDQQDQKQSAERGNVYLPRPLQLDRTITSDSSAPPTPPAKDTPEPQVLPSPLEEPSPASLEEDEESDRLRKEIVASLTPSKAPESPTGESSLTPLQPGSPGTNRASSIFPSEYKSYWAEEDGTSRRSSRDAEPGKQEQAPTKTVAFLPQSEDASKPIIKRFSWEASSSQLQTPDGQASEVSTPGSLKAGEEPKESSLTAERTVEQEHQPQPKGLSESPSGPVHTIMVTKPDSISDHEKPALPSPPLDLTRPLSSPSLERAYSPGLHVVNTEIDPEAVDLPPRLSADHEPPAPAPEEPKLIEKAATPEPTEHQPALEARREEPSIPAAAQEPSAKSPATDKPLGAREIATLNSTVERINTYNKTRDYWATVDHGLSDWLTAALEANPDVATQTYPVQRVPTQSIRHRHTGSLLFGKLGGSSSHDVPAEAHNDAAVPVPANIGSPTGGTSSGSGFGGRLANQHMQLKGKDLLHTANVLGGKGMTSAKGLFAKGKSRFGREKACSHSRTDSAPSSREVSEEPELVTRRSRAEGGWSAALLGSATEGEDEQDISNEEKNKKKKKKKKNKRFSLTSQLRRVSRSRSRANSVVVPHETGPALGAAPQIPPPGELHRLLMYGHRPHSFHAQDTWTYYPGASPPALNEYLNITNARQQFPQTRLGILPWPAKRASPSRGRDTELHVPPVPPIPNEVAVKHYRRRSSQDHASQRMLQGVGRHSSPSTARNRHSMPAMMAKESMVFPESAVFDSGTRAGAAERAQDYQALLLGVPKGAFFELELPTSAAESENRHKHGFRVGTAAAAADGGGGGGLTKAKENIDATNYDDNDDDDDQPPKLNLGPLPAGTTLGGGHAVVTDIYMDVSDEDTDDGACRGRHMAKLRAERTRSMTDTSVVTVQPQARWSTEAEMVVADDASYTSHPCSDDCANHEAAVRPQQTAADGALSPVWFASNDLRHGWTARPEIDHDADSRGAGEIGIGACGQQAWPATRTDGDISLRPELAGAAVQVQVEADTDASQARRVPARPADTTTTTASPSTASWPLGDSTTPPLYLYGAHPLSEMSEASSVATPVAPVPRMPRSEPEAPEAGPWLHGDGSHSDDGSHSADEPGGQAHLDESLPHLKPHALQPQAPHATTMAVPSRSTSILSQISAMVPEANKAPYAHASNGTSTPSAARRARPEFSKKLPAPPAQIPEEILASHDSGTAQGEDGDDDDDDDDDDFDLYADHNGIVKDVCDENGRPLRVAEATHSTPDAGLVRASHDGEPPRYSTERPMSFIAGPADQDGKPQDQINQSALPANDKFRPRQLETIYSELPGNSPEPQWDHVQPPPASISPPPSSPPPKNVLRAARSGDATKPAKQAPVEQTNSEKLNSQVSLPEELDAHEQVSQNVHVLNQDLHQPQPQRAQPILQGIFRGQSPSPVPQAQGPEQVPRNQYELHQQMLQQASNARLQSVDKQPSVSPEPPSADEALKPNGKPSAKNSASSMFKIFGGKSAGQLQHTKTPNAPVDPTPAGETAETANSVALPNHSTTEQKPCAVQISPPLDQKKHGTPAKFHRISLQQTRTGTSIKSMPYETLCAQSQPEVKKKRFAHLGSFFQKGSGGGDSVTAKPKHSKEDKKAQKALQKASAGSGESPIWNWDCRKPRYSNKESDQPSTSGNPLPNNVQVQQLRQTQKSALGIRPDEGSAFLSTKQLAAEHQAQKAGNNSHSGSATQGPSALIGRLRQKNQDPPLAEYYKPISGHAEEEQGAYAATTAVIQQQEHPIQRIRLREPQSRPQSELIFSQSWLSQREQMEQGQLVHGRPEQPSSNGQGMLQQIQPHQKHLPPHLRLGKLHPPSTPSIGSGLSFEYNPHDVMVSPAAPSGPSEPRYEATPIPAAYGHVSGAFVSPLEQQQQQPAYPSPGGQAPSALANRVGWQYGDAGMSLYTPQISAQSLMHPYHRTYSEASSISMATPMQESSAAHNSSPRPTTPRAHKPRMDSISEVQQQQYIQQQQQQQGRPWHLNFPAGATEQEIVRARQGQYMQELFHAQQQQQAERAAGSPSPGMPPPHVAPIVTTSHNHSPGGGFREILPRHPGQPYAAPHPALSHQEERFTGHHDPSYDQSAPAHPGAPPHPAAYPLPIVHHPTADPTARPSLAPLPPPKVPYTPTGPLPQDAQMDPINGQRHSQGHSITDHQYGAPHDRISHYEDQEHDEAPPSYDGIGVPNEGMDKNRPEAVRPPNINTNIDSQGQDQRPGLRPRQSSIGMLQHPQPASMAASPQRTLSDMGAESLRLQLLQQENLVQMERIQREQERRDAMMRERQEREAARARARELERSVSAGGQVGSLRSAGGSFRAPDWDRTGSQRPVFELPAVADEEEPVMKATSYPGQEWIPSFWDGE